MSPKSSKPVQLLKSIYGRCLILTAATAILVASVLSLSSYAEATYIAHEGIVNLSRVSAFTAADNIAVPLQSGDIASVDRVVTNVRDLASGLLGNVIVLNAEGTIVKASPNADPKVVATLQDLGQKALQTNTSQVSEDGLLRAKTVVLPSGVLVGIFASQWDPTPIVSEIQTDLMVSILISFALLALLLIGATFLLRWMLYSPMNALENAVKRVSAGDYDTPINTDGGDNEVGRVMHHLEQMKQGLAASQQLRAANDERQKIEQRVLNTVRGALRQLAKGDLTARIPDGTPPEFAELANDFNATARAFHDAMARVVDLADDIRAASSGIGSQSDSLSSRTENQAATLEETAAALDELTNGVRSAADGAREVEGIVTTAQQEANKSGEIVKKTIEAMSNIEKSSTQISAIIAVIDDISFQTNLLALNAGVEAARAGDAGRGFAVVASEVRGLAQRSSEAAKEIKTLIGGSSEQVSSGVQLVAEAGTALTAITERVSQIASLMSEMANNAQEQAQNLDEINIGVGNLDQVTQRNAGMVEEANAASQSLLQQSADLSSLVANFEIATTGAAEFRSRSA